MQDEMIVALYWQRDEKAISETERKYGRYLSKIAYNILSDWEDSKETVNDTYLKAWNSMPTHSSGGRYEHQYLFPQTWRCIVPPMSDANVPAFRDCPSR